MLENNRPPIGVAQFNIGHLAPIDRDVLFRVVLNLCRHVSLPLCFAELYTTDLSRQWPDG